MCLSHNRGRTTTGIGGFFHLPLDRLALSSRCRAASINPLINVASCLCKKVEDNKREYLGRSPCEDASQEKVGS